VRTREAFPLDWALTQENIGYALLLKSTITETCADAQAAANAIRASLEIFAHPDLAWNRAKAEAGLTDADNLVAKLCT